jgi:O-antigen ligase
VLTTRGVVGFAGYYAFYVLPLFLAVRRARSLFSNDYALVLGALMLVTTLLVLDTIPNSSLTLPTLFWTGALAGAANGIKRQDSARRARERELRKRPVPDASSEAAA